MSAGSLSHSNGDFDSAASCSACCSNVSFTTRLSPRHHLVPFVQSRLVRYARQRPLHKLIRWPAELLAVSILERFGKVPDHQSMLTMLEHALGIPITCLLIELGKRIVTYAEALGWKHTDCRHPLGTKRTKLPGQTQRPEHPVN